MKQYPTYKESGLVNIETIPAHWEALKLRLVCDQIFTGNTPVYAYEPNEFLVFGQRNNQKNCIDFAGIKYADPEFFAARTENEFLRYGDVLLNTLGGGSVGRIGFYDVKDKQVITDGHVMILRGNKSVEQKYLYYFLHSQQSLLEEAAVGSTNQAFLTTTQMFQWKVAVPPLAEQQAIAKFLDSKTAKIDETISLYEQQKADLVEYRKALISDTVTRGLNPNVPLKDSGIQWLGQIPEGWNVSKIKYCCDVFGRIGFRGYTIEDMVPAGEGAITLSPSNIKDGKMSFDKLAYLSWAKYEESPEIQIQVGDILLTKTGSSYGKCAYVDYLPMEATINPQFVVLKNFHENARYLAYIMQTPMIKKQEEDSVVGGAIPTMAQEDINNFVLPVPSLAEQQAIVSFLDTKTAMIDEAIRRIDEQIADLKAYRTALITDAVTGKIDVRKE